MITAVDTSVLLDVLTNDPRHGASSLEALRRVRRAGSIVACPVVWAETRVFFPNSLHMREALTAAQIRFDPFDEDSASLAGEMWLRYRRQGGQRTRLVADFLVAAHAQVRAGRLLTRDRGFFRRYFEDLEVIEPES